MLSRDRFRLSGSIRTKQRPKRLASRLWAAGIANAKQFARYGRDPPLVDASLDTVSSLFVLFPCVDFINTDDYNVPNTTRTNDATNALYRTSLGSSFAFVLSDIIFISILLAFPDSIAFPFGRGLDSVFSLRTNLSILSLLFASHRTREKETAARVTSVVVVGFRKKTDEGKFTRHCPRSIYKAFSLTRGRLFFFS